MEIAEFENTHLDAKYGFWDRLLHRLALHSPLVAETSFDLDQATSRANCADTASRQHVFIAGLARAGTTLLLRRFHATGCYRSLTYRDMPFVLAPNLWGRIASVSRREIVRAERAHGDNMLVDADSPESFDEVFWRVFAQREYVRENSLIPHNPDAELIRKYVRYVNSILSAQSALKERYLCKNNNNILRLDAIHRAFPVALILLPFREPLQQACSLLRQHFHFSRMQASGPFTLAYMTWLGHHEFGLAHRPFRFDGSTQSAHQTSTLNYWLKMWCDVYLWLEHSKPAPARFVCYEDLCADTHTWHVLAQEAHIPADVEDEPLRLSARPIDIDCDRRLAAQALAIYSRLRAAALH